MTKKREPPEAEDWRDSVLPGQRSGEGSKDLFEQVQKDIRRKAGLPKAKPGDSPPPDPDRRKS
ncbi:MAG TPA: hypothetical protein VNB23_07000 [Ramlibacter sp.]|nr:hypothetical protein [Ramlibacter sp.]